MFYNSLCGEVMNLYSGLNKMMEYIEDNLNEEILMQDLAKFIGCSSYTMERIFSMMVGFSIKEYIKKRRLTIAYYYLMKGEKVIDVAFMCGYSSASSFSRKFYEFYNIHPSEVKTKNVKLFLQPILIFDEKTYEDNIYYRIEESEEKNFWGKRIDAGLDISSKTEDFWYNMKQKYPDILLDLPRYAVLQREEDKEYYWILLKKKQDDLEKFILPKAKWFVFKGKSFKAKDIEKLYYKVYDEYLKALPFKRNNKYTLELYYENYMEIWVLLD